MIMALGFTREQSIRALKATVCECLLTVISASLHVSLQGGSIERAADWVFSHADELDAVDQGEEQSQTQQDNYKDGPGSKCCWHMQPSVANGVCVCVCVCVCPQSIG